MIIGIDIRSLAEGKHTGVEEYVINLLNNLFVQDSQNEYRLFYNAYRRKGLDISFFKNFKNVKVYQFKWPNKILNLSFRVFGLPKIDKMLKNVDLFFAPNIMFFGISVSCKLVLVIHDLSFEYYKNFLTFRRQLWHSFLNPKKIVHRADKIICPSLSTKNDLIEKYGISEKKIIVVYSGVSEKFGKTIDNFQKQKIQKKYSLPEKFILFLGALEPRKNIAGLIAAFARLKKLGCFPHKLVLAGSSGWKNKNLPQLAKKEGVENEVIFLGRVDDEDRPIIFKLSSLFVYPSFYEGFGFPPLEAMKSGVPVITSASSSLPEIVGEAAILVNPYNVEEMAVAMKEALVDEKLREVLVEKGYQQAEKFSWRKAAKKVLEIFQETISED